MAVKQISVFIENKSGGLAAITDELAAANINLRALSIAETSDFGVLRLIVDDVFEAGNVLRENGHIYTITDVIAVAAEDKPGSVAKIVSILAEEGISLVSIMLIAVSNVTPASMKNSSFSPQDPPILYKIDIVFLFCGFLSTEIIELGKFIIELGTFGTYPMGRFCGIAFGKAIYSL